MIIQNAELLGNNFLNVISLKTMLQEKGVFNI